MKKMLFLLAFVALSLTTWAQSSDFQEGQFCYRINRDRPTEVTVVRDAAYSSISGELIIPSTVTHGENTYTVTGLGERTFSGCSGVTSVSIPSSMITIGWDSFKGTAFYNDPSNWVDGVLYIDNCLIEAKLGQKESYEIVDGTRVIAEYAIMDCSSLTSVTIPSSVISIGAQVFSKCTSLSSVNIPSSVKYIGENPFDRTALYNDPSNWVDNVLYVDNCLINAKPELGENYKIVEGTRVIADRAFLGYFSTTSLTIPSSVVNIGTRAFSSLYELTDIQVESGNPAYLSENGVLYDADKTILLHYPRVKKDDTLTIPSSLRYIGEYVFEGCDYLTTIEWNAVNFQDFISSSDAPNCKYVSTLVFGEGVEHIPAYLCSNISSSLRSISVSSTVTSVGQDAFYGCGNLSVYKNYSQLKLPENLIKDSPNLTELVCPSEDLLAYATASEGVYSSSTMLKTLIIHTRFMGIDYIILPLMNRQQNTLTYLDVENVSLLEKEIPGEWFLDFTFLETAKLPKDLESIGYRAFENCRALREVTIPATVNKIGESAFENCRMLQEITIPSLVTEIDDSAFDNCRSLSAVHFGGSTEAASQCALQRIGNWAFYNCHQLQELNIPEGVTEIGDAAFYGCSYLEDLVLPSSLLTIGDNCFSLCSKLGRIIVNAAVPPVVEAKTFYEVDRSIPVYVPKGSLEAYKADAYWSEFRLLDDDPATVLSSEADNSGCYAANGMLYNPNGVSLNVYNMQGVLIYTGNATKIEMPAKGVYILMTPTTTEKVVL